METYISTGNRQVLVSNPLRVMKLVHVGATSEGKEIWFPAIQNREVRMGKNN